jgi:two-component system, OmpR family, phosphate regulon sensor histidine kinase PhoR
VPNEAWPLIAVVAAVVAIGAAALALWRGRELESLRTARGPGPARTRAADEDPELDRQELLRLADVLGLGLVRVGADGSIVLANEAAHRYLGRKEGSLTGRTTMEAFVDHRIDELIGTALARGSAQRELVFTGEPPLTLIVRARRASRAGGGWVILEDISELRRLQRIRTEFIDNLSHELRTPLTTVRLLTETLALELERTEVPTRIRDSILKIDVETGHLVQMVNELLDLSRIEQGEAALAMQELDLGRVIENAIDRLRTYGERQGVRLRGEMPASREERLIMGDEERLGQLMLNLLHNAVKFSPAGGDVMVRLRSTPAEVLIEVQDSGVGIPRSDLDRIFERFYKADRARVRGAGGTGLGLAIARHVAQRHGGRIWAESEEGKGSLFAVALPRAPGTA